MSSPNTTTKSTGRDDSALNTGLSSAAQRRIDAKNAERARKKERQRTELLPNADIILEWIDKEKADVKDLEKTILDLDFGKIRQLVPLAKQLDISDAQLIQAQILARMMHLEWLNSVKIRAKNMLREVKNAEQEAENAA